MTLKSAYAEAEIDELLSALADIEPYDDKKQKWPVGQKLAQAKRLIQGLQAEFEVLVELLNEMSGLFDRRNALTHSPIYSGTKAVRSRTTGAEQVATAEALTELAASLSNCRFKLTAYRQRTLEPWLAQRGR